MNDRLRICATIWLGVIVATFCPLAHAQVQCPQMRPESDPLRKLEEGFTDGVTLPLVRRNAGGIGPVLWAYIAGQARAESMGSMKTPSGEFQPKPGLNLWNMHTTANDTCKTPRVDACLPDNVNKEEAKSKEAANKEMPCWKEKGQPKQIVYVCSQNYDSIEKSADAYLKFNPSYTKDLRKIGAIYPPDRAAFINALKRAAWSSRWRTDPEKYADETDAAIQDSLRGVAESRDTAEKKLKQAQEDIEKWCVSDGIGDEQERQKLDDRQADLLERIAQYDLVCARTNASGPTPSLAPVRDDSIDRCRKTEVPPKNSPPDYGRIDDKASQPSGAGFGEPHYLMPSGAIVSTQAAGEFWLLKSARGVQVQVRQQPWHSSKSVAVISAVAVKIGSRRVGVYVNGDRILIDGRPLHWAGDFLQYELGDGHALGVWGSVEAPQVVALMWNDGSSLRIARQGSWFDVEYHVMPGVDTAQDRGLIGRASEVDDVNLFGRDGRKFSSVQHDDEIGYAETWRIVPRESLFDYADGESAAFFDRREFPTVAAAMPQQALSDAREACLEAGISIEKLLNICAFDLAATGERGFLRSHLRITQITRSSQAASATAVSVRPAKKIVVDAFPARFRPNVASAERIDNGRRKTIEIAAGTQKTFLIDIVKSDATGLFVTSHKMTCVAERYGGDTPGFQLFDANGRTLSDALSTCSDLYSGPIRQGKYYLVLAGARAGEPSQVEFEAFHD